MMQQLAFNFAVAPQKKNRRITSRRLDLLTNILLPVPEREREDVGSLAIACAVLLLSVDDALRTPLISLDKQRRLDGRRAISTSPFLESIGDVLGCEDIARLAGIRYESSVRKADTARYKAGDSVVFKIALHNGSRVEQGDVGTVQADGPSPMGFVSVMDNQGHSWLCKADEIKPK